MNQNKQWLRSIVAWIAGILLPLQLFAYDFEKDGLYYNILTENTVECCGGGQSPNDATYRKTEVSIPATVKRGIKTYSVVKIADYAWGQVQYLVWIKNIILPETITEIGKGAFRDANNIESINLPEGLKRIGDYAMQGPRLSEYIFPKTLEAIGTRAFNSRLKNVIFTSADAPVLQEETFAYQNGGMYDIFIPEGLKIYVPSLEKYSWSPFYKDYMTQMCTFSVNEYVYNGKAPTLQYSSYLPNNHKLIVDLQGIPSNAGEYTLSLNGKIDGKIDVDIPLNLHIKKADLNIKANSTSRLFGDKNPTFSSQITGLQNNESIDEALTNGYNLISSATPKSDVGSYSILLESDTSTNYNVNFQEGVLTITKAPLKLTIDSYTRVYGDENPLFKLNFTGLKNGEITPKWDKAPSLTTEATKLSNVGVYPITASCEPHNYDITSIENGTLTITPAPLKIISNNYSREYFTKNPVFDYKAEGFRNGDSKSSIRTPPTFKSSAELSSDCGQYPIIPSGASAMNYDITYESGVLTITPASLTVQAEDKSREYGDENPILGFNIVGLKGTDTASSALQEMPILSSTATVTSNVGQYPITITGGKSKNYTLSYRSGVLNVTKAPLSVMVGNAERTYGEANPAFTRSYLGFKLNDTETTAFSVLPKLSCLASRASNVGDYPIEVSGGTAHNYEIVSYGSGVLTITQATAILTVNNVGRLYFEANPQFDFTLSGLKNGDTKACVTTLPSYNCEAVKTSNAGTYSIVPANAFAKNYSFEYKSGELVVNQRPLTASIGSYTRIYGTENPDFEISYSGFVNNEDSNALNRLPDINCSAGLTSNVGKYPISLSGGEAVNYYFSKYNNGTLTIEKANQSITWDQDLSNIDLYSQVRLEAKSDADLPITYEMSPNNVATLYSNAGDWYLDCFGSGAINIRAIQNGDNNHNAASMVSKTLVVYGNGGDDPSNPQIFLNVETPGSLPSMIAENRKYQIKNLRLTGNLNGTDINFIREMAGSDSNGSTTPGVLEILDISGCTIVSGGRSYYKSNRTSDYTVGDYIFYNCKVLTTLRLPDNSISINDCAFADCDRLSVISISNSVESIGNQAFKNNISLLRIPMPINLKSIGDMAFYGCNGLTELDIPASVSLIGDGVVQGCQNLAKINVETGNSHYASIDGILYDSAFEELIIFPVNHKESEYKVYRSVTRIAPFAFFNAKDLKVINLPATVTSIGKDAFKGCVNLSILQVEAITPPVCQNDCFENISKTRCELQVPNGCKSYYWVAPVWSEFNRIIETDFSGIENIQYEKVIISIEGVKIKIHGCPDGTLIRVYQVNGLQVASQKSSSDCTEFDSLPSGVYIILIGQKSYKVTLR